MPFALVGVSNANNPEEGSKGITETNSDKLNRSPRQPSSSIVRRLDLALLQSHATDSNEHDPAHHTTSRLRNNKNEEKSLNLVDCDQSLYSVKVFLDL